MARQDGKTLRQRLRSGLSVPVMAAPMFLVSGPALIVACSRAGILSAFPSINARTPAMLDAWLKEISEGVRDGAAYAVNLIVHKSNPRVEEDLEVVARHRSPIVVASVGSPVRVIEAVHAYGGLVLADVATVKHARRAVEAGIDGLILLTAGCGGNTGWLNPFAFAAEVRGFYDGPLIMAGSITQGRQIRALEMLDVDMAYLGTPFIAASESMADDGYKRMLTECGADDIYLTDAVTGIPANFLRPSLVRAGFDFAARHEKAAFSLERETRAWKDVWSAGHGVAGVRSLRPVAEIVDELRAGYLASLATPAR